MTTDNKAAREIITDRSGTKILDLGHEFYGGRLNLSDVPHIKFIEKQAYDKLQQELDSTKNELARMHQKSFEQQSELDAARAEIEDLSIKLQRTVNAAQSALLETTAWMGIPEKKRENQINYAMENVKYCAEHDLRHQDIPNLKNEYQKQLADLKAQIADYEAALEKIDEAERIGYGTQRTYGEMATKALEKWKRE